MSTAPPWKEESRYLDVGVVRSGSHHSADSIHTRTHTRAVHARSACVQCLRVVRACSACGQCMGVGHACTACVQVMRAVHGCSACVQCMRAVHARSACVQCMRAVHACSAYAQCMRAVHARRACVQCMRAVHARPGRKEGLQGVALGGRRGSRGCQGRTRLRKWLPFYVLSLPRGH